MQWLSVQWWRNLSRVRSAWKDTKVQSQDKLWVSEVKLNEKAAWIGRHEVVIVFTQSFNHFKYAMAHHVAMYYSVVQSQEKLWVSEVKLNEKAAWIGRHEASTDCVCSHSINSSTTHRTAMCYSVYNNFPYRHVMISLVTAWHMYFWCIIHTDGEPVPWPHGWEDIWNEQSH